MASATQTEQLTPIVVDGSGRDGTTLLMQLLGTAPAVAFDRTYPYEQRYLSYLLHWARLPTREGGWEEAVWNLDSLAHSRSLETLGMVGPLPWHERSLIDGEAGREFWRDAFDAAWAAFSARATAAIRTRLGDPELAVRYYAQKNADSWELPFEQLPETRLLCLLRDPRDTWMSSLAFHRRRVAQGDSFLPVGPDGSEQEALALFLEDQRTRLRWLPEAERDLGARIVRYEQLVGDLEATAVELGELLELRLDAGAVLRRRDQFAAHMTSGAVAASVGRWRQEMPPELAERFWDAMGAELVELGYES